MAANHESDDEMPELIDSEESEEEVEPEEGPKDNESCAKIWLSKTVDFRKEQHHVVKIYAMAPLLFGHVEQAEFWIRLLRKYQFLSGSEFDNSPLEDEVMERVDILEAALDTLLKDMIEPKATRLKDLLDLMDIAEKHQHKPMDELVRISSGKPFIKSWKTSVKFPNGVKCEDDRIVVALLFSCKEYANSVLEFTQNNRNRQKNYESECRKNDQKIAVDKQTGNEDHRCMRYRKAIQAYSRGLYISSFNIYLYSNRAQAYLKAGNLRAAMSDGKRCIVLDPKWEKGYYRYSLALFEMQRYEMAKRVIDQGLQMIGKSPDLKQIQKQIDSKLTNGNISDESTRADDSDTPKKKTSTSFKSEQISDIDSDATDCPGLVSTDAESTEDEESIPVKPRSKAKPSRDTSTKKSDDRELPTLVSEDEDDIGVKDKDGKLKGSVASSKSSRHSQEKLGSDVKRKRDQEKKERAITERLNQRTEELKKKNQEKNNNTKKPTPSPPVSEENILHTQRQKALENNMRSGSESLQNERCRNALWFYKAAIELVQEHTVQYFSRFEEVEYVVLLFSIGTACVETGMQKEIQEGITWFNKIVQDHQTIRFPLVYLGLGKAFKKQNRYDEALEPLNKGLYIVTKGNVHVTVQTYPGSQIIIEESRPDKLKCELERYIADCKCPPLPDAMCRYHDCIKHFSKKIYLNDPDFKGYIRMSCFEKCVIEFHVDCWKRFKSSAKEKMSDKDIVNGTKCFTPDCPACVIKIQIYDQEGFIQKQVLYEGDLQTLKKKPHKTHIKMKATSDRSIEKKRKRKEKRVRHKQNDKGSADESEAVELVRQIEEEAEKKSCKENIKPPENDTDTVDVSEELYKNTTVLKKGSESPEQMYKAKNSNKSKKKKNKEKPKSTMSIREFVGGQAEEENSSNSDVTPSGSATDFSTGNRFSMLDAEKPFTVPPTIARDVARFEESSPPISAPYRAPDYAAAARKQSPQVQNAAASGANDSDIRETIYAVFVALLQDNGPLLETDRRILEELDNFPEEAKSLVRSAGGIGQFLIQSLQFALIDNYVCLLKDAQKARELFMFQKGNEFHAGYKKEHANSYPPRSVIGPTVVVPPKTKTQPTPNFTQTQFPSMNPTKNTTASRVGAMGLDNFEFTHDKKASPRQELKQLDFTTIASSIVRSGNNHTVSPQPSRGLSAETTPTASPGRPITSPAKVSTPAAVSLFGSTSSSYGTPMESVGSPMSRSGNSTPVSGDGRKIENLEKASLSDLMATFSLGGVKPAEKDRKSPSPIPPKGDDTANTAAQQSVSEMFRKQVYAAAGKDMPPPESAEQRPRRSDSPASVSSMGSSASHSDSLASGETAEKPVLVSHRTVYNTGEKDVCKFRLEPTARNMNKKAGAPPKPAVSSSSHSTPSRTPTTESAVGKKSESLPNTPFHNNAKTSDTKQLEKKIDLTKDLWNAGRDSPGGSPWPPSSAKSWERDMVDSFLPPDELREGSEFVDNSRVDEKGYSPESFSETLIQSNSPWGSDIKRSPSQTPPRESKTPVGGAVWGSGGVYDIPSRSSPAPAPIQRPADRDAPRAAPALNSMPSIHTPQEQMPAFPAIPEAATARPGNTQSALLGCIDTLVKGDSASEPEVWSIGSGRAESNDDPFIDGASSDVAESAKLVRERLDDEFCEEEARNVLQSWQKYPEFSRNPELFKEIYGQIRSDVQRSVTVTAKPVKLPIGSQIVAKPKNKRKNSAVNCDIRPETFTVAINTDPYETYREQYEMTNQQLNMVHQKLQTEMDKTVQISNISGTQIRSLQKEKDDIGLKLRKFEEFNTNIAKEFDNESKKWAQDKKKLHDEIKSVRMQLKGTEIKSDLISDKKAEAERQLHDVAGALNQEREQMIQERVELRLQLETMERRLSAEACRAQDAEITLLQLKLDVGLQILDKSLKDAEMYCKCYGYGVSQCRKEGKPVPPAYHESFTKWVHTVEEIKTRKTKAAADFADYIQRLKQGESLLNVKSIPVPQPPPAPEVTIPPPMPPRGPPMGSGYSGSAPPGLTPGVSASAPPPGLLPPRPVQSTHVSSLASLSDQARGFPSLATNGDGGLNILGGFGEAMKRAEQLDAKRFSNLGSNPGSPRKEAKNSFMKIVTNLERMFPNYNRTEIQKFIQDFRTANSGSLSGLTLSQIVQLVAERILQHQTNEPASVSSASGIAPVGEEVFQEEEDPCIICHEDLPRTNSPDSHWMCNNCCHRYHLMCIKQWLREQSTCPTCRKHVLLQEEYPALK